MGRSDEIKKQEKLISELEDELKRSKMEFPKNQSHQERLSSYESSLESRISHEKYKLIDIIN